MKILVVKENKGLHGVNVSADRLNDFLIKAGHEVETVTVFQNNDERNLKSWTVDSIKEQLPSRLPEDLQQYDVILAHDIMSSMVTREAMEQSGFAPEKVVNFMHNEPYKILKLYGDFTQLLRPAINAASVNIVLSDETKLQFEDLFPLAKFEVFDNIVNAEPNWKEALTRAQKHAEMFNFGPNRNKKVIKIGMVAAGARVREKGLDQIFELAQQLDTNEFLSGFLKIEIHLIGFNLDEITPYHPEFDLESLKHTKFISHGKVPHDKLLEIEKEMTFDLSISLFETLLVSAIEGAQLGVVVVGYDTNDINVKQFDCTVPYGDTKGLVESIKNYCNKPKFIRQVGKQLKYVESFKPNVAGNKFLSILEKY